MHRFPFFPFKNPKNKSISFKAKSLYLNWGESYHFLGYKTGMTLPKNGSSRHPITVATTRLAPP